MYSLVSLPQVLMVIFALIAFVTMTNPTGVNSKANRWLSLFFVGAAFLALHGWLTDQHQFGALTGLCELMVFAMSPALYLAVVRFTSPVNRINWKHLLLFLPFVLFLLLVMAPIMLRKALLLPHGLSVSLAILMMTYNKLHLPVYWLLTMRKLHRHQKNITLVVSDTRPVDLHWLKLTMVSLGVMILTQTALGYFKLSAAFGNSVYLIYLLGTLCVVYFLLGQREIYPFEAPALAEVERTIIQQQDKTIADKPRLNDQERDELCKQLERLMNHEQLFLDSELSLPQLAGQLQVTTHDLSWLINNEYQVNFFQYINRYRVAEAKRLLLSDAHKHLNVMGIAYSAGFNSKTTFNTVFKKETGLSPSQFVQQKTSSDISIRTAE